MPLYYFHIHNDVEAMDLDGQELPGPAAARDAAVKGARSLMAEAISNGDALVLHHSVEVADAQGESLFVVTFGDAVTIRP